MKATKTLKLVSLAGAAVLAALAVIDHVDADGIPAAGALSYSGTLEDPDGTPIDGSKEIRVSLFDAVSGGSPACEVTQTIALSRGRFQIVLPDECTTAARGQPELWVEVAVDGETLGRTKLSAVPYAVEAARAGAATGALAAQVVPAGAVMAFDLDACPSGWTPVAEAAGRTIVGVAGGLARGARVGADAVALSIAQMPAHAHTVNDPGHSHTVPNTISYFIQPAFALGNQGVGQATVTSSTSTTGITLANSGAGQAFDNRQASLALLYCRKS